MVGPLTPCGRGIETPLLENQGVVSLEVSGTFLETPLMEKQIVSSPKVSGTVLSPDHVICLLPFRLEGSE